MSDLADFDLDIINRPRNVNGFEYVVLVVDSPVVPLTTFRVTCLDVQSNRYFVGFGLTIREAEENAVLTYIAEQLKAIPDA